jgi:protein-S-isoprenylcysteine O-methyltransferase Ste14
MIFERYFKINRIKLTQYFIVFVILLLLFSRSGWEGYGIITTLLFLIGTLMVGIATVGRLWCSIYISGYKTHTLIMVGPYSICRNPLYLFSLIGTIGLCLNTETILLPIIAAFIFLLYYPSVIEQEERKLRSKHTEDFEAYCRTVPRLIPSLCLLEEPETYVVRPKVFRKRLFDSLWFVWGIGIIEIIEGLHESGVLPALFNLY